MRSQIPGCARLCDTCPKRPERAVLFTPATKAAALDNDESLPEVDPLEVNRISITHVYGIRDFGNVTDDTPFTPTAQVQQKDTIKLGSSNQDFPFTLTLDMIEQCQGPESVKYKWYQRATKRCGAYMTALALANEHRSEGIDKLVEALGPDWYDKFLDKTRR